MNEPTKYDPPEAVVPHAFRELLERLRRARLSAVKPAELHEEERKAFEYGVQKRKRVLEHTLFLVFGQWALYRQAISRLKSRGFRLLYGAGAVVSTIAFVQRRASQVSADTFAHIVTTGVNSSLGNEARIVLAELEGPDGPYFRTVCRERGFETDLVAVVADMEEGGDPVHDLHPQLRLRPRLLTEEQAHPQIAGRADMRKEGKRRQDALRNDGRDFRRGGRDASKGTAAIKVEDWGAVGYDRGDLVARRNPRDRQVHMPDEEADKTRAQQVEKARERELASVNGDLIDKSEDAWGKPFDFAKAAMDFRTIPENDTLAEEKEQMTPSQRRAAERRLRRLRAQSKNQRGEAEEMNRDERFA